MTSKITVEARPAAPNNVVEVSIYGGDTRTQQYVLESGAIGTFHVHGDQSVEIRETQTIVLRPAEPHFIKGVTNGMVSTMLLKAEAASTPE